MRQAVWFALGLVACRGATNVVSDGPSSDGIERDSPVNTTDGAIDSTRDAMPDGAIDAAIDAQVDAPVDAAPDPNGARLVAVAGTRSCALRKDGTLWCWGEDLGPIQTQVGTATDWTAVDLADQHRCGIRSGTLWCWGSNVDYQLGLGDQSPRAMPTQVGTATDWSAIATGEYHTCGLRSGTLWCWGSNDFGQAGNGATTTNTMQPVQVGTATDWTAITVGQNQTCGLRAGTLWCWGRGYAGALGLGNETDMPTPTQVGTATDWVDVRSNYIVTCGRRANGSGYCWGQGPYSTEMQPTQVSTDLTWTELVPTTALACGIRDARLACIGNLGNGGLGDGSQATRMSFVDIGGFAWKSLDVGQAHVCGIRTDDTVWCWGSNVQGRLGLGTVPEHPSFTRVGASTGWSRISLTFNSLACGIDNGRAYCWGTGGAIGNGTSDRYQVPAAITSTRQFTEITTAQHTACAIATDTTAWCWGSNQFGVLGNGSLAIESTVPTQVGALTGWSAIDLEEWHACGIAGGAMYCWGRNAGGQLGDNTTIERRSPVRVGTASDWTAVTVGSNLSCGVRAGALYCWGTNVGMTPTQIGSATDWEKLSFITSELRALKTTKTQWRTLPPATPVQASTYTNWLEIDGRVGVRGDSTLWQDDSIRISADPVWARGSGAPLSNICGIQTDGSLWCRGDNRGGQLGLGDGWAATPTAIVVP